MQTCTEIAIGSYIKTASPRSGKAYKAGGHFHIYSLLLICSSRLDKSEGSPLIPVHPPSRGEENTLEVSRNNSAFRGRSQFTQVVVIHPSIVRTGPRSKSPSRGRGITGRRDGGRHKSRHEQMPAET